jgi:predicted dienelactone hydrolase
LCINVQHVGSDSSLYLGKTGQGKSLQELMVAGANAQQAIARFADIKYVLDELQRRQASGSIELRGLDLTRVGMSGHSFGAETTLGVIGESFPGVGGPAAREPRISAAIPFSPSAPGKPETWPARFQTITIPTLTFTGTLDGDVIGNGSTPENRRQPFANMAPGDKYLAVLDTANHAFFNNPAGRGFGTLDPNANKNGSANAIAVRAISTAFWETYLMRDPAASQALHDTTAISTLVNPGTFAAR